MIKNKQTRRTIAVFFLLNFLSTMFPYNTLYANNNGPSAPEAAAFEPVDATDMVNLVTGDFSYVLPLLNVPSPEGGYPLALSYHAGIAMDQEASWVGLGWNINPGAINRNVNGNPDDWGNTNISEFFYDKGWEKNYYSFEVGGVLPNGITLGLGASWGSDRAFGGMVSFGFYGIGSIRYDRGKISPSLGLQLPGGLNFGIDSDLAFNVGVGGLNYSSRSGLSGRIANNMGLGVSLSSEGVGFFSKNIQSNSSSTNLSKDDYYLKDKTKSYGFDLGVIWAKYRHRKIEYALYKQDSINVTGALYPYNGVEVVNGFQKKKTSMDVYSILMPNIHKSKSTLNHYEVEDPVIGGRYSVRGIVANNSDVMNSNRYTMLSKDNYSMTSQGLSGSFSPYSFEELQLYDSSKELTVDGSYVDTYRHYYSDYIIDPNVTKDKTHFYFEGTQSSFLRINKGELYNQYNGEINDVSDILDFKTYDPEVVYNETFGANGELLRNNDKLRSGRNIVTYTNKEIREGNLFGFIDAREGTRLPLNRYDEKVFLDDGIGAFQITALDGKTYHYSLPVYNFEEIYRNFESDKNEEDTAFYERIKDTPYATHWLLTAVTGPDYVDVNNNGRTDSEDYGYWVEFDYGKWSDGYAWRSPNTGYAEFRGHKSYSLGRKQIYYLDAIKTRTHTALFIKSLREDAKGSKISRWNQKYTSGIFNVNTYSKSYTSKKDYTVKSEPSVMYYADGTIYNNSGGGSKAKKVFKEYMDLPENRSLKLSKILIVKNDKHSLRYVEKGRGNDLTVRNEGNIHVNDGYNGYQPSIFSNKISIFTKKNILRNFSSHFSDKVLDEEDVNGLELDKIANKSITFNYNYELAKNTPTSQNISKGRLTLKEVVVGGKQSTVLIPPYKFEYFNSGGYSKEMMDNWGYYKDTPEQWSLNKITTPTGADIKINYESDSFYTEAAHPHNLGTNNSNRYWFYSDASLNVDPNPSKTRRISKINLDGDILEVTFLPETINTGQYYIKDNFKVGGESYIVAYPSSSSIGESYAEVIDVNGNNVKFKLTTHVNGTELKNSFLSSCQINSTANCINKLVIKGNKYNTYDYATFFNPNGKNGGGLRVKSIQTLLNNEITDEIRYSYKDTKGFTSGITTYEPSDIEKGENVESVIPFITEIARPGVFYNNVEVSRQDKQGKKIESTKYEFETFTKAKHLEKTFPLSDPSLVYSLGELIKVKWNSGDDIIHQNPTISPGHSNTYLSNFSIENKSANLGRLLSIKKINGEGQIISSVNNKYKENLDSHGELGVKQETFRNSRKYKQDVNNDNMDLEYFYIGLSSKINYPSKLESTEETSGGLTVTKHFDKHDFLTGQVLETRTYTSDGTAFKTKTVPAYTINEYSKMGSKVDDVTNRNMLTQEAVNYSYIFKDNDWKPVGVGITTWYNDWDYIGNNGNSIIDEELNNYPNDGIGQQQRAEFLEKVKVWRKHKTYTWNGAKNEDGTLGFTEVDGSVDFNWGIGSAQTTNWQVTSNVTRYNQFSQPLELKDINGNYTATKMGFEDSKIIATANAGYNEMYYSSAEYRYGDYFNGGVKSTGYKNIGEDLAHTGTGIVEVNQGIKAFELQIPTNSERNTPLKQRFKVSVWCKKGQENNLRINVGSSNVSFNDTENIVAGDWILKQGYIRIPSTATTVSIESTNGMVQLDDFRLHPVSSSMMSYVYNEWDEVSYITGANGLSTHYVYDAAGRLIETQVETITNVAAGIEGGFKKVTENKYNYKRNNQ